MKNLTKTTIVLLGIFFCMQTSTFAQTKQEVEIMMDEWANDEFNSCFTGRTYKSISVSSYNIDDYNKEIKINGYVSYLNLLDISVRNRYEATLKVLSYNKLKVIFEKYDSFTEEWETCERTYRK